MRLHLFFLKKTLNQTVNELSINLKMDETSLAENTSRIQTCRNEPMSLWHQESRQVQQVNWNYLWVRRVGIGRAMRKCIATNTASKQREWQCRS